VVDHLANQHVAWARLVASIAAMHAITLQSDIAWLRNTPEQRYRDLLAEHPGIVSRVTQRDLANFLNITDDCRGVCTNAGDHSNAGGRGSTGGHVVRAGALKRGRDCSASRGNNP
jgi:hypothetical protein